MNVGERHDWLIGERVMTAHGPTGRDYGVVTRVQHVGDGRERGEPTGREHVWCEVRLDDGSVLSLDWVSDGNGRIRIVP